MKSKEIQNVVLSKWKIGKKPSTIFLELEGQVSLATIKRWVKMFVENGTIDLRTSSGRKRTARSRENVQRTKRLLKGKKRVTIRKLVDKLGISVGSAQRIMTKDLKLHPYKLRKEPNLTDDQKASRVRFFHYIKNNFKKSDTENILFSDEKRFTINGVYNSQNDRVWAVNRGEADEKGATHQKRKFPQGIMVWLGACTKGLTPLVIIEKGTINREVYIEKILPVAKKYGDKVFGNNWIYQQDGATCHTARESIEWCTAHFPQFINKDRWPANSPDLNPLDYSIWNEFVQAINWNKVSSKPTLIKELKAAVKRIPIEKVLESCRSWTNRLYRMYKLNGAYLAK